MAENTTGQARLVELTVGVVSAYVSNNPVPVQELGNLIASVYSAISSGSKGAAASKTALEDVKPSASSVKRSIGRDGLISFIDGKSYKTLKRHLTGHGMTPAQYREKFGLPADYPLVAPSYSERRAALAKSIGLGQAIGSAPKGAPAEQPKAGKAAEAKGTAERKPAETKSPPRRKAA